MHIQKMECELSSQAAFSDSVDTKTPSVPGLRASDGEAAAIVPRIGHRYSTFDLICP